ncbi:MAG TPA: hypothetical protein PKC43_10670 [Phycisphaerales bacterium]|nr:hypothetical protein [Phycisphaerales bacterium]HMP37898.1 hypothetical protein [Phycisphaerales bacterium]
MPLAARCTAEESAPLFRSAVDAAHRARRDGVGAPSARSGRGRRASIGLAARVSAALLCGALLCGCASPVAVAPPAAAPDDLTISVTVLVGEERLGLDRVERRPGRYIVFPDGTIHADVGRTITADVRPGRTRQLRREQLESLWGLARRLGLADPREGEPPGNDVLIVVCRTEIVHVLSFETSEAAWRFVRRTEGAEPDAVTTRLVRELAALAWVPDDPPESRSQAVVRYDFGPDPYASLRVPAPAPGAAPAPAPAPRDRR